MINIPKMLKYDQILVYSNPPILPLIPDVLHRLLKKKYSFVVYDIAPDNAIKTGATRPGSMIDKLMRYINRHVYKNAENVIVLGTEMKNYLLNHQISKNADNIHVIPNWYDMRQLQDNRIYNDTFKAYREQYDKILLYSGNMGQLQDMETLISFLKLNKDQPQTLTILCGHGKKFADVKTAIEDHRIENVKMFEFLTGTDYADVLKIADVCIASLIKEGVGLGVPSKNYGYLAARKRWYSSWISNLISFNMLNNMMRVSKLIMAMHMPFITSSTLTRVRNCTRWVSAHINCLKINIREKLIL